MSVSIYKSNVRIHGRLGVVYLLHTHGGSKPLLLSFLCDIKINTHTGQNLISLCVPVHNKWLSPWMSLLWMLKAMQAIIRSLTFAFLPWQRRERSPSRTQALGVLPATQLEVSNQAACKSGQRRSDWIYRPDTDGCTTDKQTCIIVYSAQWSPQSNSVHTIHA